MSACVRRWPEIYMESNPGWMCTGSAYCTGDMQKLPAPFCPAFDLISGCVSRNLGTNRNFGCSLRTVVRRKRRHGPHPRDAFEPESGDALLARPLGPFDCCMESHGNGQRRRSEKAAVAAALIAGPACQPPLNMGV